jgi:hypothetical protein
MNRFDIQITNKNFVSNVGLVYIATFLNSRQLFAPIETASKIKRGGDTISDYDIVKTYLALICLGKTNFDDVEQYRNDKYFRKTLKLRVVPSAPTLRQRLETWDEEMCNAIRRVNIDILKSFFKDESVIINDTVYTLLESDVTPMDNSKTKKEGVSRTYKSFFGFAPMMSYAGKSGFMINNELRYGAAHSNCEGTDKYLAETISLTKHLSKHPIFTIMDSGNDDKKLIAEFYKSNTEFIVKRNLRRESRTKYVEFALANHELTICDEEKGVKTYYVRWTHKVESLEVPIAVVVREFIMEYKTKQPYLIPNYEVDVYWSSLNMSAYAVEQQYHKHGTSEQYHSEFKSDLDMERLPSGDFSSNYATMLIGMVSFNLLRITGKKLLRTGYVPGERRGQRLRIKTVIQNVMYMAGQLVEHARKKVIQIFGGYAWTNAFVRLE